MVKRTKIKKYYAFANIIISKAPLSQQNIGLKKTQEKKGRKIAYPALYF
ncbi:hypothetical protein HX021_02405 [Sphingobacterium sp. N143]|nr:hypothetical protein [Sphingobacterium sp. N143]MDM1293145.1 hypothetical protein [Sphingobacterium sp. N143]